MLKHDNMTKFEKYLLVCSIIFFIPALLSGQTVTFEKIYRVPAGEMLTVGYIPNYNHQDTAGDYMIIGPRGTGIEGGDIFLLKVNQYGDTLWSRIIGQTSAESVIRTSDGCYVITTTEAVAFVNWAASVLVIKINEYGDTSWVRKYGTGNILDYKTTIGYCTAQMTSGNLITVGVTDAYGAGEKDIYLIKSDITGNTFWRKTIGDAGSNYGKIIKQTPDYGFIICGTTYSDGLLVKTDSSGIIQWSKKYDLSGAVWPADIEITSDHGFLITGYTNSFGSNDIFVIKTDSLGNILWNKIIGNTANDGSCDISLLPGGGFMLTGYWTNPLSSIYNMILIDFNSNGDTLWTRVYDTYAYSLGYAVSPVSDGGFLISGRYLYNFGSSEGAYTYLVKTDSMGNTSCSVSSADLTLSSASFIVSNVSLQQSSGGVTGFINYCPVYPLGLADTVICYLAGVEPGLLEKSNGELQVYPNPATDIVNISENPENEIVMLQVFDLAGKCIYKAKPAGGNSISIDVSGFQRGVYFVKLNGKESVKTGKLIVQ